jgi:hypothetical protein
MKGRDVARTPNPGTTRGSAHLRFSTSPEGLVGFDVIDDVDVIDGEGSGPRRSPGEIVRETYRSFEETTKAVSAGVDILLNSLMQVRAQPDEVTLEFGISLSADAGAVITKTSDDAHFHAVVAYRRQEES